MAYTPEKPLLIGTDCSGIDAPIQALRHLGIPFRHVFSSEIDSYCIQSLKANYNPEIIFGDPDGPFKNGDITKRDIANVPAIDMYICGFPCQPFSQAGDRKGFQHKSGNVFWSCVDVIKARQPKFFILENVRGLLWHSRPKNSRSGTTGPTWNTILESLDSLEGYTLHWKVLNTKNYGIPQSRERLYIVGVQQGVDFTWPAYVKTRALSGFVNHENNNSQPWRRQIAFDTINPRAIFIDPDFLKYTTYPMAHKVAPPMLARANLWCCPKMRYADCKECLSLQGFPTDFVQVVSDTQLRKQVGNSMSVNVLIAIFRMLHMT
jgi:DNA (cytosine-5)-methyltransferase 1